MIDEKKVEEAAKDYAWNNRSDEWGEEEMLDTMRAFKTGIGWFLENLWHDASEKPEAFVYILAETEEFHKGYKTLMFHGGDPWEKVIKFNNITRWLYIEDLMKAGK